jgi:hypothetical protein
MRALNLPGERIVVAKAQMWKRVLGFIIDLIVIDLLFAPSFSKFIYSPSWTFHNIIRGEVILPEGFMLAIACIGIIALLYFSLFEWFLGGTPGMRLFGLEVTGARSFGFCLVRNLYALPFFPFTILWFVEPFYFFVFKERLLERWSKTTTVEFVRV